MTPNPPPYSTLPKLATIDVVPTAALLAGFPNAPAVLAGLRTSGTNTYATAVIRTADGAVLAIDGWHHDQTGPRVESRLVLTEESVDITVRRRGERVVSEANKLWLSHEIHDLMLWRVLYSTADLAAEICEHHSGDRAAPLVHNAALIGLWPCA